MIDISIIVPCYNQAHFLSNSLQSVLNQTYANWECIIVNDGSPDHTEEVAKEWVNKDARFIYLVKENGGLSSARNFGLKHAKGKWIQLLDADDLLLANKLKDHITHFNNNKNIQISVSGYRYFTDDVRKRKVIGNGFLIPETVILQTDTDVLEVLMQKNPFVISAPLYHQSVFDKVGFFDEELTALEDWDFHTRCALFAIPIEHMGYGIDNITLIRLHGQSMMQNLPHMKQNEQKFYAKRNMLLINFGIKTPDKEKINIWEYRMQQLVPPLIWKLFKKFKK